MIRMLGSKTQEDRQQHEMNVREARATNSSNNNNNNNQPIMNKWSSLGIYGHSVEYERDGHRCNQNGTKKKKQRLVRTHNTTTISGEQEKNVIATIQPISQS